MGRIRSAVHGDICDVEVVNSGVSKICGNYSEGGWDKSIPLVWYQR